MAQKTDSVLKSFFQTGDIPTEGQYVDLIDSKASIAPGQINSGSLIMTGSISGTLDLHAKKIVLAHAGSIFATDSDGNIDDTVIINIADTQLTFGSPVSSIPLVFQGPSMLASTSLFKTTGKHQFGNSSTDFASFSGSITAINSITASRAIQANGGLSGSFISASSGLATTHLTASGDVLISQGHLTLGRTNYPASASLKVQNSGPGNTGITLHLKGGESSEVDGVNNVAGGDLILAGGRGKGTGAGGNIIFKTAQTGSSGYPFNSFATALTIDDDKNATFNGIIDITDTHDATDASGDTGALRVEGGVSIAKKIYIGETLNVTGNADLDGDLDVDGTTNLDNTDIDGTLVVDGTNISLDSTSTLNIDNSNTSNGISIGTATSGVPVSIGHSTSETTVGDNLTINGELDVASIYNTSLKIGRASGDTTIAFNVDDNITFKAASTTRLQVTTSGITANGTVVATSHISSSGGGNVYGAQLVGGNMGTISEAFIPIMPTDFNVNTSSTAQIQVGAALLGTDTGGSSVGPSSTAAHYVASYIIPVEKTAVSVTLYGGSIKTLAFVNDIRTSTSAALFTNGAAGGQTNAFAVNVVGNGYTYVSIFLYFSGTSEFFDGGHINLQPS